MLYGREEGLKIIKIIKKAKTTHDLSRQEISALLSDSAYDEEIFRAADCVRKKYVGEEVHLRGLIEFSNICSRNCLYCGLRSSNTNVHRYRLEPEVIIDFAEKAAEFGYKTMVLQSGEDPYYTVDMMGRIIGEVKKLDVAVTLSMGEKSFEEYRAYKDLGADRYLIRIETSDRRLYDEMNPGMNYDERVKCIEYIRELGFEVGTGCLVGLPGQTPESLADDILFFKEVGADMVGVGPFIPNPDTPLKDAKGGTFEQALKVMAITRLLMPDINIPATTAMEALNPKGRLIALQSGANVVMPNVTEGEYRKFYELYPGKICVGESPEQSRYCITGKITGIGRSVSRDKGFRKKRV